MNPVVLISFHYKHASLECLSLRTSSLLNHRRNFTNTEKYSRRNEDVDRQQEDLHAMRHTTIYTSGRDAPPLLFVQRLDMPYRSLHILLTPSHILRSWPFVPYALLTKKC